ncbi:aconitase 1 [Actinidia rufa]|uniref:Aconitase 1 n=1 Tax=Actinidia rufa TaxID=165716 RepID=A0A7J0ENU1_9ERIC|nr:aconitase 1 [Actinidia rufa]
MRVPADLVIDHSVQADVVRSENTLQANMELLKWGSSALHSVLVAPPGSGIVHQVNLEYLGRVVFDKGVLYSDTVVGTDSHTTIVDALGIAGWGVGWIEAEATTLGQVKPWTKTSLAPGSGVVLQDRGCLDHLGYNVIGYGCTTCIGNSGDFEESVASSITENDLVAAAVLSGNWNFEGRVHPLTRENYLASPPLADVYALAGTLIWETFGKVDIDFETGPIGLGEDGKKIFLKDVCPSNKELQM